MDELLSRVTNIPISIIDDGMKVQPNHIYLIPPSKNLTIIKNRFKLDSQKRDKRFHLPVDVFFCSLAKEKGRNSIGVVLSGTGSDGTFGVKAIKEERGFVIVQDPKTAKFDGMPKNCINTRLVDLILAPDKIPQAIVNYVNYPHINPLNPIKTQISSSSDFTSELTEIIKDYSDIDFSYYKESTLFRRLERRIIVNKFTQVEGYLKFIKDSDEEKDLLLRELMIGVTGFLEI